MRFSSCAAECPWPVPVDLHLPETVDPGVMAWVSVCPGQPDITTVMALAFPNSFLFILFGLAGPWDHVQALLQALTLNFLRKMYDLDAYLPSYVVFQRV